MAVTLQIFLLFIGAVIVQSHHLYHYHHHHHHRHHHKHPDVHGMIDNIIHSGIFGGGLFGSNNMHGNEDSVQDGYVHPNDMGQEENHAPFDIGTGHDNNDQDLHIGANRPDQNNVMIGQPNESKPDDNLNIDVAKDPQIADDHDTNSLEPEAPTVTVEVKPDKEPETDDQGNQTDNNQPHLNMATDKVAGQKINTGSELNPDVGNVGTSGLNQQRNPEETNNDSINNVPGFNGEDIKKGILIVNPDSINYKVPEFNDQDIKKGIVMVNPDSINYKVLGFNDEDIKKGIVMVNPDSINYKVPGFLDGDMKKGILMVTDSNTYKVLGFLGKGKDKDIKKDILLVDPKLKYNINEGYKPDMNVAKESISQNNPSITTENADDLIGSGKKDSGFIGNTVNMGTFTDEPKLSHNIFDESQFSTTLEPVHKETGPGFSDEEIKKGILMIDPEFKINDTYKGLDKYSDEIVFPDKVAELKQNNQVNAQQNLTNRFSTGDNNNNQYPSVTPSVLTATVQPANNNIQAQWMTPNSIVQTIPTSNNQGTLNQPSSFEFVQNPNQQVSLHNGNGYVHVVRKPNGDYTIINFPDNNGSPNQAVSGNSRINNPGQHYVLKNPGQTYVNTNSGYSGINKPSQIYVTGNSGIAQPRQIYVTDRSGVGMPGQMYVSNNVPSSGRQAGNGGYYNVIQLNNGQTIYVPVNNGQNYGNGQNTQWNGQSNNGQIYYVPVDSNQGQSYQVLGNNPTGTVTLGSAGNQMNGGSTNYVPLLISYKDKERENEGSEHSDSRKGATEE